MNRPKQFFDEIATFRKTLRTINSEYQTGLVKIERLKGSAAYDEEKKKLDENHSTSVKAAQDQAAKGLSKILSEMRTAATSKPMTAPTPEAMAILQTLKMRNSISADELRQAALSVEESALALSVLDEIAQAQGYHGLHFGKESTDSIMKHIDELSRNAQKICRLTSVDQKKELVSQSRPYSENYDPAALELFSVDRDFKSVEDCLAWLGSVKDFDSFCKAVN